MTMPQYQRMGYGRFLIDFSKYTMVAYCIDVVSVCVICPINLLQHIEHLLYIGSIYDGFQTYYI